MKRIAVFVATTHGPVRVERVTRERAPQSMVCLQRTSTVLPISNSYDSFVRPGSGVVERVFGPFETGAFRLDLSGAIESGESWQLGVFLAHALTAASDFALASEEDADAVVWLTGRLDCDLQVGSVNHMAEKIFASRAAIAKWLLSGRPVTLFAPPGSDSAASSIPRGARFMAVNSARDVLAALGLGAIPSTAMVPVPRRAMSPLVRRCIGAGIIAAAIVVSAQIVQQPPAASGHHEQAAITAKPTVLPAPSKPAMAANSEPAPVPKDSVKLSLYELRAPEGRTCAEVQFGAVQPISSEVPKADGMSTSTLPGLCALGVTVDAGGRSSFVTLDMEVVSGKLLYGTVKPKDFNGQTAFTGQRQWVIDLPRRMPQPFEVNVTATSRPAVQKASFQAAGEGAATASLHHKVMP